MGKIGKGAAPLDQKGEKPPEDRGLSLTDEARWSGKRDLNGFDGG
jgi:hypothetical protein